MAVLVIYQRTRDNIVVNGDAAFPAGVLSGGLTFDGEYFWLYDRATGDMCQWTRKPLTEVRRVAVDRTLDDMCFDGEYIWAALGGNQGIGQFTREGQRLNNTGGITSASLEGIAYDGAFLWAVYVDVLSPTGGSSIVQVEHQGMSQFVILKTISVADRLQGLAFDGEHLISQTLTSGTRDLCFYTREGALVRKVTGEPTGADGTGLTFDGEYVYTLLAV